MRTSFHMPTIKTAENGLLLQPVTVKSEQSVHIVDGCARATKMAILIQLQAQVLSHFEDDGPTLVKYA